MRVHFVVNVHRPDAVEAARTGVAGCVERGWSATSEADVAPVIGAEAVEVDPFCDLLAAYGGDGTLIRAAHLAGDANTPILGIYFGRFGFVTEFGGDALAIMDAFVKGTVKIEARMMLQCALVRHGESIATLHALNEIALQRSVTARMMHFSVTVDDVFVTRYPADGVIVSSPTGSTAYNLSAGGPIIQPTVRAMALTAIAPHTLGSRTLVLHEDAQIRLTVETRGEAILSADGQTKMHLLPQDELVIGRSSRVTNLVTLDGTDFLDKLGKRLLWSRGLVEGDS